MAVRRDSSERGGALEQWEPEFQAGQLQVRSIMTDGDTRSATMTYQAANLDTQHPRLYERAADPHHDSPHSGRYLQSADRCSYLSFYRNYIPNEARGLASREDDPPIVFSRGGSYRQYNFPPILS